MRARTADVTAGLQRFLRHEAPPQRNLWRRSRPQQDGRHITILTTANGAAAVGALAFGAIAIGALAIRRLFVRRMRVRSLVIDELTVRRLIVRDGGDAARAFEPVGQGAVTNGEPAVPARTNGAAETASVRPLDAEARPGDEASSGTPGTGEMTCPVCGGSGLIDSQRCENCTGSGKITRGIGGG